MATFIGVLSEIYSLLYAVLAKIPESELRTLVYPEQEIKQSFRQALEEPSHLFAAKLAPDVAFGDFSVPRFDIESAVTQIAAKHFSTSLLFGRSRIREFSNELAGVLQQELQRYLANALTEISHDVERRMFEVLEAYRRSVDEAVTSLNNQYPIQTSADSLLPLLPKDRYSIIEVRAIQYASPGFTDLAGIGTVIGHIKDFVLHIIEHCAQQRKRKLEEERMALDNFRLEIENEKLLLENAKVLSSLMRANGYSKPELEERLESWLSGKQEPLLRLASDRKVVGVRELTSEPLER